MNRAALPGSARIARNREIIVGRLRSDFNAREERVRNRLATRFPGIMGFPMRKAAEAVLTYMGRRNLPDYVAEAAARFLDHVQAGDVHELKEGEAMGRLLELFDHEHARYAEVFHNLDRAQYALMKLYERLLVAEGDDYPQIVRTAFPGEEEVKGLAREALGFAMTILRIVDEDSELLHTRGTIRRALIKVIHSMAEQLDEIIMGDIEEIYAGAAARQR